MLGASTMDVLRGGRDLGLLRVGKAGGADHHGHAVLAAGRQVRQRASGRVKSISSRRPAGRRPGRP
jgi:hypothetical protein